MRESVIVSDQVRSLLPSVPDDMIVPVYTTTPAQAAASFINESSEPAVIVFFVHPSDVGSINQTIDPFSGRLAECAIHLFPDTDTDSEIPESNRITGFHFHAMTLSEYRYTVKYALSSAKTLFREKQCNVTTLARLEDMKHDQDALIWIGRSLQTEKDSDKLLRTILMLSKKITGADAGSIYIIEETEKGKQVRFKYSHTFSKELPLEEFVLPYNTKSIAGYVAVTGTVLNIPDVNKLSASDPVSFNNSFDKANNYYSKSMLVVPMKNHIDEIIGVIQLINSKEDFNSVGDEAFGIKLVTPDDFEKKVVPFDSRYEHLMEAVAGQAAIAIENNRMIEQIQTQFEEFVKASVTAIESRDPATSGHSFRVAEICVAMARAVNASKSAPFAETQFTETQIKELEYAALLHDFGKVYIDLGIFKKAKKLFPQDLDNLLLKLDYLYRYVELCGIINKNDISGEKDLPGKEKLLRDKETETSEQLARIREIKEKVLLLNEPTVTDLDPNVVLDTICGEIDAIQVHDITDSPMTIFNNLARTNLRIKRGSLNEEERREIESHVTHTYTFVSKIPWPPEF
ncbi:MAG TPA: GAF domain-containing protein, partial [Spirochaetota bacterium]|nr:GAF domain-containing protein [Spirochaetota bacterium]